MKNTVIQHCVIAGAWEHEGYYEGRAPDYAPHSPSKKGVEKPGTVTITGASVVFDDFILRCEAEDVMEACEEAANILHAWLKGRLEDHGIH